MSQVLSQASFWGHGFRGPAGIGPEGVAKAVSEGDSLRISPTEFYRPIAANPDGVQSISLGLIALASYPRSSCVAAGNNPERVESVVAAVGDSTPTGLWVNWGTRFQG